jgi:hypothetical protein
MNPAQLAVLKRAANGFCRTTRLSWKERELGVSMHTVAGLVRSGHIFRNGNGFYRLTEKGFHALPPGGHMQGDDNDSV